MSGVCFLPHGRALVSSSLDGTVRAFDTMRYRNFQTFVSPTPAQFTCVAVEPSGELVVAGSRDTLLIYVWNMQTAQLLDSTLTLTLTLTLALTLTLTLTRRT